MKKIIIVLVGLIGCLGKYAHGASYDSQSAGSSSQSGFWTIPLSIYSSFSDRAFDNESQIKPLSYQLFAGEILFKNIDLFTNLSDSNKVRIFNGPANMPERSGVFIGPNTQFGAFSDDLYPTLLADTKVCIEAEAQEVGAIMSLVYQGTLQGCYNWHYTLGLNVPFKSRLHIMDIDFVGGSLFREAFNPDQTVREDSLKQFFRDYIDIYDYFQRGILNPKDLVFKKWQRKTGIADISVWGALDFSPYIEHTDLVEIGLVAVLPTGGKQKQKAIWEPILGNGGAFQFDMYTNIQFRSCSRLLNPMVRLVGEFSAPFTSKQRVARLVDQNQTRIMISEFPELNTPPSFQNYFVDTFDQFDSGIAAFADQAIDIRIRYGSKFLFSFGNYFYELFNNSFRLGLLYTYLHKNSDNVPSCAGFNTASLSTNTQVYAHSFGWNLAYQLDGCVELNIGSEHLFAGRNSVRNNEIFATLALVF